MDNARGTSPVAGKTGDKVDNNPWGDPRTWITLGSLILGVFGFLFGVASFFWNKRESRLEALGGLLSPMLRASTLLKAALTHRRNADYLRHSFSDASKYPEAAQRHNELVEDYGKEITKALDTLHAARADILSKSFRFPDHIDELLKGAFQTLVACGDLINSGHLDRADVELAKFTDDVKAIRVIGRGWRLNDPIEWARKRLFPPPSERERSQAHMLTPERVRIVLDLVHKRTSTQAHNTFAVHAPAKLVQKPAILESPEIVEELKDSVFRVTFQDGSSYELAFVQLLLLIHQLIILAVEWQQIAKVAEAIKPHADDRTTVQYKLGVSFSEDELLRPEMAKVLLSKVQFAELPSDSGPSFESNAWQ